MKRSKYALILLGLAGSLLMMPVSPSYSQTANPPKRLKVPTQTAPNDAEYGSVRAVSNERQRSNPLRSETVALPQENTVQQAAGVSSTGNSVALAAQRGGTKPISVPRPQTKPEPQPEESFDEFSVPVDAGDFSLSPHELSAPVPQVHENLNPPEPKSQAVPKDSLEQVDQFSDEFPSTGELPPLDSAAPFSLPNAPTAPQTPQSGIVAERKSAPVKNTSRPIPAETITPQNANPIAQIDSSATVQAESNPLTPPSPTTRGTAGASPQVAMQPQYSRSNAKVGSLDRPPVRQPLSSRHNAGAGVEQEFAEVPQPPQQLQSPEGTGVPGSSDLEGNQCPQLVLEKLSPQEVQINQPATLKIVVKNTGQTTAREIILRDQVPRGTRLVSTNPKISGAEGGDLYWSLGSLAPQEEIAVEMTVVPLSEGEFGSVATLQFASEASGKTIATRAMLNLDLSADPEVLLGDKITYHLTLTNPGSGTTTGVVLELHVPEGLEHEKGRDIEFTVGDLKPKETKQYPLVLSTKSAGEIITKLRARANNELESVAEARVEVLAPDLRLEIAGPRQRYLNHKAAYVLTVANPGTASAQGVDLLAKLPTGMKFESTNQQGVYDEQSHTVHWTLEELPPKESGEIELVATPLREGEQMIRFEGIGRNHLKAESTYEVSVQGIPSLTFGVACLSSPVEVGKTAIYEVKLVNRGTKSANNVNIHVRLSEGMQFSTAEGPTKHRTNSGVIQFDPLAVLEPQQEKTFKFTAKCLEVGDHRVSVSMSSDEQKTPVTKEESTLVYGDE